MGIVVRIVPGASTACIPGSARVDGPGFGPQVPGAVPGTSPTLGQDSDIPAAASRGTTEMVLHAGDAVLMLPGVTMT